MWSLLRVLLGFVVVLSGASAASHAADPAPADPVREEARRRGDTLVVEGFNLTHGWRVAPAEKAKPIRLELAFPEAGPRSISLWFDLRDGEGVARLEGPDGKAILDLAARRAEWATEREFPEGRYVLTLEPVATARGEALFGVKGAVVAACPLPAGAVEVAASPADGFRWPYLLVTPAKPTARHLLVAPNNTGFASSDLAMIRASGSCQATRDAAFAAKLGVPLLVPLFPRPPVAGGDDNLYLHALTRGALEATSPEWRRVDLQLLAMVKDARARLAARGFAVERKVLLRGFSASGSFVDRFAKLHPDEVLAVVCGSPGGWPMAPVAKDGDDPLPYPVGVADLGDLGITPPRPADLRKVRFLYQLGDRDANDAVPYRDSFSKSDEDLVLRRFGATPVARWKEAERLHRAAGLDARFVLVADVGHEVTREMDDEAERFLREAMGGAR